MAYILFVIIQLHSNAISTQAIPVDNHRLCKIAASELSGNRGVISTTCIRVR